MKNLVAIFFLHSLTCFAEDFSFPGEKIFTLAPELHSDLGVLSSDKEWFAADYTEQADPDDNRDIKRFVAVAKTPFSDVTLTFEIDDAADLIVFTKNLDVVVCFKEGLNVYSIKKEKKIEVLAEHLKYCEPTVKDEDKEDKVIPYDKGNEILFLEGATGLSLLSVKNISEPKHVFQLEDGTVLNRLDLDKTYRLMVWNVTGLVERELKKNIKSVEFDEAWKNLDSDDGKIGFLAREAISFHRETMAKTFLDTYDKWERESKKSNDTNKAEKDRLRFKRSKSLIEELKKYVKTKTH